MKLFATALLTLAMATTATAQVVLPKNINFKDQTGKIIGTGVLNGNRIVIRNVRGELLGTLVINPDRSQTLYDPDGKIVKVMPNN